MTDLKTLLKDNRVHFSRYHKGHLYYRIHDFHPDPKPESGALYMTYEFPVPTEDIGDATFNETEKALLFMRYIRKAQEDGNFVRV